MGSESYSIVHESEGQCRYHRFQWALVAVDVVVIMASPLVQVGLVAAAKSNLQEAATSVVYCSSPVPNMHLHRFFSFPSVLRFCKFFVSHLRLPVQFERLVAAKYPRVWQRARASDGGCRWLSQIERACRRYFPPLFLCWVFLVCCEV